MVITGRTRNAFVLTDTWVRIPPSPPHRDVAQFGRALRSGRRGRRFKSCHPDQKSKSYDSMACFFMGFSKGFEPQGGTSVKKTVRCTVFSGVLRGFTASKRRLRSNMHPVIPTKNEKVPQYAECP